MAISSSSDWTLASMNSSRRIHFISSFKLNSFSLISTSNVRFSQLNSTSFPFPLLEEEQTPSCSKPYRIPNSNQDDNLNDFLSGLFQDNRTAELGFEWYQKAQKKPEFRTKRSTINLLVRYLIRSNKWDCLLSIFDHDVKHYKVVPDAYTCSKLITRSIRARKFRVAETVLEVLKSINDCESAFDLAFESAMRSYNKLHMFRSTVSTFEILISARNLFPNSGCYFQIMKAYFKLGNFEEAIVLYRDLESEQFDLIPFSSQIFEIVCQSLCKLGREFEAIEMLRTWEDKEHHLKDTPKVYSTLIYSFASIREMKVAEDLLREAAKKKILKDSVLFLKLISIYVDEGLPEKTLEMIEIMKAANLRVSDCICCSIVNGFSKIKGLNAAIRAYELLVLQGCEAGQVTYASMLNIYCRLGLYSKAETVFSEMQQRGFDKCIVAYGSIMVMYGKIGRIKDAMRLVALMKERGCKPNVWIYNSLLEMHGRAKNLRQVEKLWKEMARRKVAPDKVSYTSVLSAYNKAREFQTCLRYYHEYRINEGKIDMAMAGIMVSVFSKMGRIDELVKLLQDMKFEGTNLDDRLYRSALNALRDAGLQLQAKWLLQENFEET